MIRSASAMREKLPRPVRLPVEYFRWDRLRKLSHLTIVKLTPLMPILGYLLIFNRSLQEHFQLSERFVFEPLGAASALRLYALYFGGTAFGIGSIIYQLRCPAEVKEHGTAWTFVAREGDLIDAHRLHAFKLALIEARYGAYLRRLNCPVGKYHEPIDRYGQMLLARDLADEDREFVAVCDRFVENLDRDAKRWGKTSELMADYFVSLRRARPGSRMAVVASYAVGFVLLAYPTLDVFGRVIRQFAIFVSSAAG